MKAPHTPGPWHFVAKSQTIVSNQSHPVALLTPPFHRQVRGQEGNDGPLIAAAPEMLDYIKVHADRGDVFAKKIVAKATESSS